MLKNRIEYCIVLLITVVLFIFYNNFFFFYLLLCVALIPFVSLLIASAGKKNINVEISFENISIGQGNKIPIKINVSNFGPLPLPGISLKFRVQNKYYPNEELQIINLPLRKGINSYHWYISPLYSGCIELIGIDCSFYDYLGLKKFSSNFNCNSSTSVIPTQSSIIMNIIEDTFTLGSDEDSDSGEKVEDVTQIKEFREYRPGDRIQRVNWKITAKHDNLFVKEFEQQFSRSLTLLVELHRDSDETGFLDELLCAVYSAAEKLTDMDILFSIMWYDTAKKKYVSQLINDKYAITEAFEQMFLSESYTDYSAFENCNILTNDKHNSIIYFTSSQFEGYEIEKRIGIFKERVMLICLQ